MKYVGIDLHKKTVSGCVVIKERGQKQVAARQRLECRDEAGIKSWFSALGKFEVVVEATASYEWFVKLVEPLAQRVVLAHPKKLRIIAESKRKSDNKLRHILAACNADVPHLFTAEGRAHLAAVTLSAADRFVSDQLVVELEQHQERLAATTRRLREFAASAPLGHDRVCLADGR